MHQVPFVFHERKGGCGGGNVGPQSIARSVIVVIGIDIEDMYLNGCLKRRGHGIGMEN